MMRPEKIISGGQTGVDQAALLASKELGIPTGGTAPKGWRTEAGPASWLADYGLVMSTTDHHADCTKVNVRDSDATVIFGSLSSIGSALTLQACEVLGKPHITNPNPKELAWFVGDYIKTLNVAGNRESVNPGISERVRAVLMEAFI